MNVASFLERAASSSDNVQDLRLLAADLAHESERQSTETLGEIRRGLARLRPQTEGAQNYLLALRDVLSGIENARLAHAASEERREAAEVKPSWHPILTSLLEEPLRPSELAGSLGMDPGQVSRELKSMRMEELVEVYASPLEDARSRRHRLTADGRKIAETLSARSQSAERAARAVISFVTHVFALLFANRRLAAFDANERATTMLDGTRLDPRRTWELVVCEAKQEGMVTEENGVLFPVPDLLEHSEDLEAVISEAARAGSIPKVLEGVLTRAPAHAPIVVRSSPSLEGAWRSWANTLSLAHVARIFLITNAEMVLDEALETPGSVLLYDSLRQLHTDLQARAPAVDRLAKAAVRKVCLIGNTPAALLPAEFEAVRCPA